MQQLDLNGATINCANAGLAAGTTSTYTTTATTAHVIGGKYGTTLAAQTNTATPTTDVNTSAAFDAQGDDTACAYVFGVNAAGAIKVAQGAVVATQVGVTTTAGDLIVPPPFPPLPDDFCPIGYVLIRSAPSASAWTFGSSNWDATGITDHWYNVATLPSRPQTV